jgi:hypothetical protein
MFELKTTTECELTSFTGRTQKSGRDDVPAVSFRLKISDAKNTLLDMLSPTIREVIYAPIEGQEQLPGVEVTTPVLRCREMKTWKSDTVHEGWKLFISRGIAEDGGLQMGSCKVDEFTFDLLDQGFVNCEFRISTADLDEEGAGMLWGRQKRKVFVQLHAPELPAAGTTEATGAEIDGTRGHPGAAEGQASLLDTDAADGAPRDDGLGTFADDMARGAGGTDDGNPASEQPTEPQRGPNWPFPQPADASTTEGASADPDDDPERDDDSGEGNSPDAGAAEQAELEAGMRESLAAAGVKPKGARGRRVAA